MKTERQQKRRVKIRETEKKEKTNKVERRNKIQIASNLQIMRGGCHFSVVVFVVSAGGVAAPVQLAGN